MKLVIDIPEQKYEWIKDNPLVYTSELDEAVRNGIPLDKIKDDIYNLDRYYIHDKAGYVTDERVSYYDVINVIDKYRKEQE